MMGQSNYSLFFFSFFPTRKLNNNFQKGSFVNAEAGIPCPECGQHYLKDSDLATHRAKRHGVSMY